MYKFSGCGELLIGLLQHELKPNDMINSVTLTTTK